MKSFAALAAGGVLERGAGAARLPEGARCTRTVERAMVLAEKTGLAQRQRRKSCCWRGPRRDLNVGLRYPGHPGAGPPVAQQARPCAHDPARGAQAQRLRHQRCVRRTGQFSLDDLRGLQATVRRAGAGQLLAAQDPARLYAPQAYSIVRIAWGRKYQQSTSGRLKPWPPPRDPAVTTRKSGRPGCGSATSPRRSSSAL